jgi:hypothetical protein
MLFEVVVICGFTPVAVWIALTMKYVSQDGKRLIVRNYWRKIDVPLQDIDRIRMWPTLAGPFVIVELQRPSLFGKKFGFVTPMQTSAARHPVVQELLDLVDRTNRST